MDREPMVDITSNSGKDPGSRKKKGIIIGSIVAAVVVALGVCGFLFGPGIVESLQRGGKIAEAIDTDKFYAGIVIQGVDVGGKTMEEAREELKAVEPTLRDHYEITLKYQDKTWPLTEDDMEFTYNTEEVLQEAYRYAREGSDEERYEMVEALKTTPKEFTIQPTLVENSFDAKLKEITGEINVDPVDPTVKSFNASTKQFEFKDGVNGVKVNEEKLYQDVEAVVQGEKVGTVEIQTEEVPFDKSVAEIRSNMQEIGSYSTVSTNTANGTYNMARALSKANGTVIPAGGTFSFNGTVGNCNAANGFKPAHGIQNGKLIDVYGGGICQASTTIYGAALRAGATIVQRYNHSIQSTYCPIGLDATVSWGGADFKFKNNTEYPMYLICGANGRTMYATIYGYQSPEYDKVEIKSWKTETIKAPTTPEYVVDSSLKKGQKKLDVSARNGARASAQRIFYKNGKVVRTENLPSSYYRPQAARYLVGPGTDTGGGSASSTTPSSKPSSSSTPASSSTPSSKPSSSSEPSSVPESSAPSSSQDPESSN